MRLLGCMWRAVTTKWRSDRSKKLARMVAKQNFGSADPGYLEYSQSDVSWPQVMPTEECQCFATGSLYKA